MTVKLSYLTCFRLDKDLVAVEKANLVDVRWTPSDQQYKAALQIQVVAKCKQLVEKMKPLSQERQFLLKLKEKYSGNMFTACLCIYAHLREITFYQLI